MKKKILLMLSMVVFAACLFAISASAININGIEYSLSGTEATVTSANQSCQLTTVNIPETITVTSEHTEDESLYGTYTVTKIEESAFYRNDVITSITTPSTIKVIQRYAFREMPALVTLTLNASEEFTCFVDAEIYSCAALKKVDMSGCVGLTKIGDGGTYDHTFVSCKNLEEIVFPQGITYIGTWAFQYCSKLSKFTNLDLSKVTYIGAEAFRDTALSGDIILSDKISSLGAHTFRDTDITGVVIKGTPTALYNACFFGCSELKYVVLPQSITSLNEHVFRQCGNLEYIVMGSQVASLSTNSLFLSSNKLKAIIYTGTEEQLKAITNYSSVLGSASVAPFSDYVHGTLPSTRTVYFGATTCGECNGILGEKDFIFTDLISDMKMGQECKHCNAQTFTDTFAPMFVDLGYSTANINGQCSIVQGFKVNRSSVTEYNEQSENDVADFGVLAVAQSKVDTTAFDENGNAKAGVIVAPIDSVNDYFEIKVANIPETGMVNETTAYVDAMLYMCAYVNVGGTVYYISEDYVGTTLGTAVSYNTVK